MKFDWTNRSVQEWRELFNKVPRANWLQSLPFARAARVKDQKVTRLALIRGDNNGEALGMMAIQEIKLGPIHVIDLYRGPLWFVENPPDQWLDQFADLFNKSFPRRLLRRRRWLPEWKDSESAKQVLKKKGFKLTEKSFETIWLDLTQPEAKIRAQLDRKWRNHLSKGERSNIGTRIDWNGKTVDLFLNFYQKDLAIKKYRGRNAQFVKEEIIAGLAFRDVLILWAVAEAAQPIAGILIFLHGQTASYRIGWTTDAGRKFNAHNVLLWEAVKTLTAKSIKQFDLGGIVPEQTEGVTQFKRGMGGENYKLIGVVY